jgi:hypothetical protein
MQRIPVKQVLSQVLNIARKDFKTTDAINALTQVDIKMRR